MSMERSHLCDNDRNKCTVQRGSFFDGDSQALGKNASAPLQQLNLQPSIHYYNSSSDALPQNCRRLAVATP